MQAFVSLLEPLPTTQAAETLVGDVARQQVQQSCFGLFLFPRQRASSPNVAQQHLRDTLFGVFVG
ncbi:MAG: hypothetical protein N2554_10585 [Fimbriimonadales bacterium]|nr:hypothetical protein [Fimbriimonadales bacterium]